VTDPAGAAVDRGPRRDPTPPGCDVLLVEDKASLRAMLRRTLEARGYRVAEASDTARARALLTASRASVILTDLRLPDGTGLDVLRSARELDANAPVVVMTAYGTIADAVAAMKEGAFDFLAKPVDIDHLLVLVERAIEQRRLLLENLLLKEEFAARYGFPQIIGEEASIQEASRALQRASPTDATVLLLGESGTGKELFARACHHLSPRRGGPFVAINCAAIPEPLLENELFGHEKGAFTGAVGRKMGRFEMANGGTVFLDEVGELPLGLQTKLLRVLQERSFERVGGTSTVSVDVRLVAASNRDLQRACEERLFREDLYFRLSVFPITIPPLRARRRDIPLLARHYVDRYCRELKKAPLELSVESLDCLVAYDWPGNVRELGNCMERAVILCDGGALTPDLLGLGAPRRVAPAGPAWDLGGTLGEVGRRAAAAAEREKIRVTLEQVDFDKAQASEKLRVSGKTLAAKMREYGLDGCSGEPRRFASGAPNAELDTEGRHHR
jgi:DNA-binding NtrC family response regulator